jgi:hypothetical protein
MEAVKFFSSNLFANISIGILINFVIFYIFYLINDISFILLLPIKNIIPFDFFIYLFNYVINVRLYPDKSKKMYYDVI